MVTFFTLHVAQRLRFFEPKPIDARTVISFGLLNGISIGLLNLCLGFNSVGFYQVSLHKPLVCQSEIPIYQYDYHLNCLWIYDCSLIVSDD